MKRTSYYKLILRKILKVEDYAKIKSITLKIKWYIPLLSSMHARVTFLSMNKSESA